MPSAILLVLVVLATAVYSQTQRPGADPYPPRPGYVLADDEWLPEDSVYGESVFTPDPWPFGQVPYRFSFTVSLGNRDLFRDYVKELECVCGVDFIEDVNATASDYILVVASTDPGVSSSEVGHQGGSQLFRVWGGDANNANHWPNRFLIVHELMHALGFRHEQTRTDRDSHVIINWSNIPSNRHHNFQILTILDQPTNVGTYDFDSIMHYGSCTFSACNLPPFPNPCVGPASPICPPGTLPSPTPACFSITTTVPANQGRLGNLTFLSPGDVAGLIQLHGTTTAIPSITSMNPPVIPYNQNTLVTITGENFYLRSTSTCSGYFGSFVKVNGVDLSAATTYVDRNTLTVQVPAWLTFTNTCLDVVVNNQYFGDSMPEQLAVSPAASSATVFPGTVSQSNAGFAIADPGDVDGDGLDDIVIGIPHYPVLGVASSGIVECRSGADGSLLWSAQFGVSRLAGSSLSVADFNGDRVRDVIVGCPGVAGIQGGVYVVDGRTGTNLLAVTGPQVNDGFGNSVDHATDLTGDGVPEIIVGAPFINQARIINGSTGATYATFNGASSSSFGLSVSGGQDLNGNGVADVAIGAPANNGGQGAVSIYDGQTLGLLVSLSGSPAGGAYGAKVAIVPSLSRRHVGTILIGRPGWQSNRGSVEVRDGLSGGGYPLLATIDGIAAGDFFGRALGAAGDLDQDGYHEFLVGAPQGAGAGGTLPGYARLFDGRTRTLIATYDGGAPDDGFGWSVLGIGDTDGDALGDIAVGAPFADPGCGDSGMVQVLRPRVGPSQRALKLSEVRYIAPLGVEITNHDFLSIPLFRWRVRWLQGSTLYESAPLPSITLHAGHSFLVGFSATGGIPWAETPPGVEFFPGLPSFTVNPNAIVVGLITPGGVTVDEVRIAPYNGAPLPTSDTGGMFRGLAPRLNSADASTERIWGLDSNAGHDWTVQDVSSMGLENRSSGLRGLDTIAVEDVVINEIDDAPDYVEFRNKSASSVDIQGWFVETKPPLLDAHQIVFPWKQPTVVPAGGYFVIGDGPPPSELPPGTPYVNLQLLQGGPTSPPVLEFGDDQFEFALYDLYGRLVDLVRVQRRDAHLVFNDPRAPSSWRDFTGGAARIGGTMGATGRDVPGTDADTGSDWRPIQTRTMGSDNLASTWAGPVGHGHQLDVRLNDGTGHGLTIIINAGPPKAGHRWSFLFSVQANFGMGPLFGLGADALTNYLLVSNVPPWFGILDQNGSARLDFPANSLPSGIHTENIFLIQSPTGSVVAMTKVIALDT